MTVNRRSFLGTLTLCSSIPLTGWARTDFGLVAPGRFESSHCAIVDLGRRCKLPESLAGYESGLKAMGANWTHATADSIPLCPVIIVPGFASGLTVGNTLREAAERGSTVLIESGATFDHGSEFENHRRAVRSCFSIDVQPPLALWDDSEEATAAYSLHARLRSATIGASSAGIATRPYVDFVWPRAARIRDFSRAVPVSAKRAELVAVAPGGILVALRRKIGRGAVIFLGSPAGPSILFGDREARAWLAAVVAQSSSAS